MIRTWRALLGRELARLAAGRVFLFGGLVALLFLSIGGPAAIVGFLESRGDVVERAAELRAAIYGMTGGYSEALFLLAAILGAMQIGSDIRAGTIFGVLARPVSRRGIFLAGWTASACFLTTLELLRSAPFLAAADWLEGRADLRSALGVIAIILGHWLTLAAFASLGAALSPAYAALAGLASVFVGGLAFSKSVGGVAGTLLDGLACLLPLPTKQESLINAAISGSDPHVGPVLETILYRASWTALLLVLGALWFERRNIAPRV